MVNKSPDATITFIRIIIIITFTLRFSNLLKLIKIFFIYIMLYDWLIGWLIDLRFDLIKKINTKFRHQLIKSIELILKMNHSTYE